MPRNLTHYAESRYAKCRSVECRGAIAATLENDEAQTTTSNFFQTNFFFGQNLLFFLTGLSGIYIGVVLRQNARKLVQKCPG